MAERAEGAGAVRRVWVAVGLALVVAVPAVAQEPAETAVRSLTMEEAVAEALRGNAALEVAGGREAVAATRVREATSSLWPQVGVESGWLRTTDPVAVFGGKLRQGRFTEADLALDRLNDPAALDDWATSAGVRWAVGSPVLWATRSAVRHQAEAARWGVRRQREATVVEARLRYLEAVRAESQLEAATAAVESARATAGLFRRRREEGLLTEADALQAEAELLAAESRRTDAARGVEDARRSLGVFLGWGPDRVPRPAEALAEPASEDVIDFDPARRADLQALDAVRGAAAAGRRAARASYLPTVEAFAGYGLRSADPFGTGGSDWTAGVAVRLPVFTGFARGAAAERARLEERIAATEYEQRLREARAEVAEARGAVEAARQGVAATSAASRAAAAADALVRRRFEQGLATPADLLQADARAAEMRGRATDALARYQMSLAQLRFVQSQATSEDLR